MGIGVHNYGTDYSGETANRPTNCPIGEIFFDTTTGALLVWDGTQWLDTSTGTPAAAAVFIGPAAPPSPTAGLFWLDAVANLLSIWDGAEWIAIITTPRSGPTALRPTGVPVGTTYFDTDLGEPIWWNGTDWVDGSGGVQ